MKLERMVQEMGIDDQTIEKLRLLMDQERQYRRQRQAEGIARAKERGVQFGRPRVTVRNLDHIYQLYMRNEISITDASKLCGVPRSTIYRKLREYSEKNDGSYGGFRKEA